MNTIHIFAYGEAQIIKESSSFKTDVSKFTKLQMVIDDIKSKKPSDVSTKDYHCINIFNNTIVDYICDEREGNFSTPYNNLDINKLNDLIQEFEDLEKQK